jgi:hypothetical protein
MTDASVVSSKPEDKSFAEKTVAADSIRWKPSKNGSQYCRLDELDEHARSQLKLEDKFTTKIDGYRYTVKNYEVGWLVFRRDLSDIAGNIKKSHEKNYTSSGNIAEIKVFTLDEANKQLCSNQSSFELFGSDPVKVVHDEIKVVMARRIGSTNSLNGEDSNDQ